MNQIHCFVLNEILFTCNEWHFCINIYKKVVLRKGVSNICDQFISDSQDWVLKAFTALHIYPTDLFVRIGRSDSSQSDTAICWSYMPSDPFRRTRPILCYLKNLSENNIQIICNRTALLEMMSPDLCDQPLKEE